ncbi:MULTISPECIES: hypothetical protein [Halomonadaceae]|jgi:hypothetical protein|uniref:Uncharacterized protein n=1 Tax=Vreelandella piezotolerans TaxID=2609667 RepID=A0ABQ6X838_9GAMM|nr:MULTISPECIES: hypothetical protein [Halomonas]KAE8438178.1 hypothetical protein F1978_10660 [Halomonas piezotolerans]MCG7588833.1 hypothetical protein [Halomonas sp. McD50-5]MCG7614994.1 hypothetical protein [Halomonas sp. McD50-4]QJA24249.1 hypothetical protein GYM47_09085 [Halomonas piezotolerans]BCB62411.1 hypothetical protein HaloA020_31120 [Halomonas sp. A020]|tara:strand:- start:884 stop:1246 length:363 start_codon:yes stop_codon:yes gene_type:complete
MKYQKVQKQLDEREKLRKFRELDDAFAQALRQLDDPDSDVDIPTGPPVRSLEALEADDQAAHERTQQARFAERLTALMIEYGQSDREVKELIETLLAYGLWEIDQLPVVKSDPLAVAVNA